MQSNRKDCTSLWIAAVREDAITQMFVPESGATVHAELLKSEFSPGAWAMRSATIASLFEVFRVLLRAVGRLAKQETLPTSSLVAAGLANLAHNADS